MAEYYNTSLHLSLLWFMKVFINELTSLKHNNTVVYLGFLAVVQTVSGFVVGDPGRLNSPGRVAVISCVAMAVPAQSAGQLHV